MAALGAAVGMLLGLYARDRGAGGQETLTSMLSTMGHVLSDVLIDYEQVSPPPVVDADAYGFSALYRLYRASDGWVVLCAPDDQSWTRLAAALPADLGLADGERFRARTDRTGHDDELAAILTKAFEARPAREWEQLLSDAGVGCAEVAPMQGGLGMGLFAPGGVGDQLGFLTTVKHPIFDEHIRSTELVRLSRGRSTLGAGCRIGQHTDEILRDRLGFDEDRISRLRAAGVIGG
jgi:crotonobetainyl-CoA:carnitine CoA-transferase CaiB-like acyl-CoA transferase